MVYVGVRGQHMRKNENLIQSNKLENNNGVKGAFTRKSLYVYSQAAYDTFDEM